MSGQATSAMLPQASDKRAKRDSSAILPRAREERNAATASCKQAQSEKRAKRQAQCCRKRAKNEKRAKRQTSAEHQASTLSSTKKPASKRGRFSFVCKLKLFSFSFSNNGESNVSLDFLIQLNNSCIFAQFLGIFHHDALAINFETQLSQFFSNLDVAN